MTLRRFRGGPVALLALSILGCRTVVVGRSTASPLTPFAFSRTLIVVDLGEEGSAYNRALAEAYFAKLLAGLGPVPSSRLLTLGELHELDDVKTWAKAEGFDGLVVLSLDFSWTTPLGETGGTSLSAQFRVSVVALVDSHEVWSVRVNRHNADLQAGDIRAVERAVVRELRAARLLR